jgi:RHS repeat-associated protein
LPELTPVLQQATGSSTTKFTYTGTRLNTQTSPTGAISKFFYDDNGNLSCVTKGVGSLSDCAAPTGAAASANLLASYTYDDLNRLDAFRTYDGTGAKSLDSHYVYDALNRTSTQTETHGANAARTTAFSYLGISSDLSQEQHKSATGSVTSTRNYSYDPAGGLLGMSNTANGTTTSYTYGYNLHGDVSQLINSSGTATSTYGYTPYGAEDGALTKSQAGVNDTTTGSDPEPLNPFRYSARRFDTGSGTLDMGARRYGPDTMHFLQQDQYAGALDDLSLSTDPLNDNRYMLAGANPINFVETDGHAASAIGGGGSNPRNQASCVRTGRLLCTLSAWRRSSWQDRNAWLTKVQHRFGLQGWLNVFKGVVKYFGDSPEFKNSAWAAAADAGTLWPIGRGLAAARHVIQHLGANEGAASKWSAFFGLLFSSQGRSSQPTRDLKVAWGVAESGGIKLGLNYASDVAGFRDSKESFLAFTLTKLTDTYRWAMRHGGIAFHVNIPGTKVGFGLSEPDPRRDDWWVRWAALGVEKAATNACTVDLVVTSVWACRWHP